MRRVVRGPYSRGQTALSDTLRHIIGTGTLAGHVPQHVGIMRVISVTCDNCGAPLEIPKRTRYVTCSYCSSRLQVHHTGNAVYTEVLEAIEQATTAIAEDVETLKLQSELDRLDREWMMEKESYTVRGKDGEYNVPSAAGGIIGGAVAVVFGIFWIGMASSMGAPGFFPLFGLVVIGFAIFGAVTSVRKADMYATNKRRYEQQRRSLAEKIGSRPD